MITHMTIAVKCACGSTHDLPVDIDGRIRMICRKTRRPGAFTLDRAQFATLTRHHPDHAMEERATRIWTVHRVGRMVRRSEEKDRITQRCEDCGATVLVYADPVAATDAWYPAGGLVTVADFWSSYAAKLPLNPLRERRCYARMS